MIPTPPDVTALAHSVLALVAGDAYDAAPMLRRRLFSLLLALLTLALAALTVRACWLLWDVAYGPR